MIRVGFHVWLCAKHYAMNRYANRSDMFSKVREVKMERYLSKISWENAHVRNYDMAEFVMPYSFLYVSYPWFSNIITSLKMPRQGT